MKLEFDLTYPDKIFRGNSITFECHVNIDLSNYKIRAELFDQYYRSIKLATSNDGGSDDEIEVIDEEDGTFKIYIAKDTTECFHLLSFLEIDLEDEDGKVQTVYFSPIQFADNRYWRI